MRKILLLMLVVMVSQASHAQKGALGYQIDSAVVANGQSIPTSKDVYEYDNAGRQTVCYNYYYNRTNPQYELNSYVLLTKKETTYKENGVLAKDETFRWDSDAGTFTKTQSTEVLEYDPDNGQPCVTLQSNFVSWEFSKNVVTKFNGDLPEDIVIYNQDQGDEDVWNYYADLHYEYDADGRTTLERISIDYAGMFTLSQTIEYEYDEHGNVVKETSSMEPADMFGDEVDAVSVTSYQNDYDDNGNLTSSARLNRRGEANEYHFYYWSRVGADNIRSLLVGELPLTMYDLTGRPARAGQCLPDGLYIIGGKKVHIRRR